MNLANILQIVSTLPVIIDTIQKTLKGSEGPVKKDHVRTAVLSTTQVAEAMGRLTVIDRKKFNKELDKVIDGVVGMLKVSEWREG